MKLLVIVLGLLAVVSVHAQPPFLACGPPPSMKPPDCCTDLSKLATDGDLDDCKAKCGPMNPCCKGKCFAEKFGIPTNGAFDKTAAIAAIQKKFGGDAAWSKIVETSVNECVSKVDTMTLPPLPPMAPACAEPKVGVVAMCILGHMLLDCPTPVPGVGCDATRTFVQCMKSKMM